MIYINNWVNTFYSWYKHVTRCSMISRALVGFSKTSNSTRPLDSCNFDVLEKLIRVCFFSKLHLKSCMLLPISWYYSCFFLLFHFVISFKYLYYCMWKCLQFLIMKLICIFGIVLSSGLIDYRIHALNRFESGLDPRQKSCHNQFKSKFQTNARDCCVHARIYIHF